MRADYVLIKPHRINGVVQPIGHAFTVPEQLGDALAKDGIAERVTPRAALLTPPVQTSAQQRPAPVFNPRPRRSCCGGS